MVESKYALKKFIQCAGRNKKSLLFMNFETNLAVKFEEHCLLRIL